MTLTNESGHITFDGNGITVRKDEAGDPTFHVSPDGEVTMKGTIHASAGKIGGYTIGDKDLTSGNVGMSSDTTPGAVAFWAGSANREDANFKVLNNGEMSVTAKSGTGNFGYSLTPTEFTVWNGNANNPVLQCNKDGLIISGSGTFAGNGTFTGVIKADSGYIGELHLENGSLSSDNFELKTASSEDDDHIVSSLEFFRPTGDGNTVTTSVSEEGIVTPTIDASEITANTIIGKERIIMNNGISIHGLSIDGGETGMDFDAWTGDNVRAYKAVLVYSDHQDTLKVTLGNDKLLYPRVFEITYKVVWGTRYKTASISIPAGYTEGSTTVSAFWGIEDAYFSESADQEPSLDFTQGNSESLKKIEVRGTLAPASGGYSLGAPNQDWDELRIKKLFINDRQVNTEKLTFLT